MATAELALVMLFESDQNCPCKILSDDKKICICVIQIKIICSAFNETRTQKADHTQYVDIKELSHVRNAAMYYSL